MASIIPGLNLPDDQTQMSSSNEIITDAQAKAVEQSAKAVQQALAILERAGGYLGEIFGTVPHDLVGLLGGDWLRVRRAENVVSMTLKAKDRLEARKVRATEPPPLTIMIPLMIAAADESRDELQDIWARLLAAATDPNRARSFRLQFIEVAKKLDPIDAVILQAMSDKPGFADATNASSWKQQLANHLRITQDQMGVSLLNLGNLDLLDNALKWDVHVSVLGREFLRAIND